MDRKPVIGLLGGSFNPVHSGHMIMAGYMSQFAGLDEVWMLLSPLNPLKSRPEELASDIQRLHMLELATTDTPHVEVCDIELTMPRPSYTINTLRLLAKRYPKKQFKLIIGSDNWSQFSQWRDHEEILSDYGVIIYPRPGYPIPRIYDLDVEVINAPKCELSSSFIRAALRKGKDVSHFVPHGVSEYIKKQGLYITNDNEE